MTSDVKVDGFNLSYRDIKARFKHCVNRRCYTGVFQHQGDHIDWEKNGFKEFLETFKQIVDNLLE